MRGQGAPARCLDGMDERTARSTVDRTQSGTIPRIDDRLARSTVDRTQPGTILQVHGRSAVHRGPPPLMAEALGVSCWAWPISWAVRELAGQGGASALPIAVRAPRSTVDHGVWPGPGPPWTEAVDLIDLLGGQRTGRAGGCQPALLIDERTAWSTVGRGTQPQLDPGWGNHGGGIGPVHRGPTGVPGWPSHHLGSARSTADHGAWPGPGPPWTMQGSISPVHRGPRRTGSMSPGVFRSA
jgi:hypothetical protein